MKTVWVLALCFCLGLTVTGAQETDDDPLDFYKGYLEVLAKAKSLDELLPFYTKEMADGMSGMPEEMKANYLKMNAQTLTDLVVTDQQVDADRAEYQMTAKLEDGTETTGRAVLVKEDGVWKIEDWAWATPTPREP